MCVSRGYRRNSSEARWTAVGEGRALENGSKKSAAIGYPAFTKHAVYDVQTAAQSVVAKDTSFRGPGYIRQPAGEDDGSDVPRGEQCH